jgi:hypothetical protein
MRRYPDFQAESAAPSALRVPIRTNCGPFPHTGEEHYSIPGVDIAGREK